MRIERTTFRFQMVFLKFFFLILQSDALPTELSPHLFLTMQTQTFLIGWCLLMVGEGFILTHIWHRFAPGSAELSFRAVSCRGGRAEREKEGGRAGDGPAACVVGI